MLGTMEEMYKNKQAMENLVTVYLAFNDVLDYALGLLEGGINVVGSVVTLYKNLQEEIGRVVKVAAGLLIFQIVDRILFKLTETIKKLAKVLYSLAFLSKSVLLVPGTFESHPFLFVL